MTRSRLLDLLAIAAVVLACFWQLGAVPLLDVDEGAFSEATREMLASGNFVSTTLDGEPRHDKPILIYWLQAASVSLLGLNELALRLPSAIAAALWALALYRFAARVADRETAGVAVLVMALGLQFGLVAKAAIADALLNLLIALTFFDIYRHAAAPRPGTLLRVYLWLGLGFLAKGPIAVALPLAVTLVFYLSLGRWRDWLRAVLWAPGIALFLAIVVPWHVASYLDQGTAFFEGFYLRHNLGRYTETMEGHGGDLWYYLVWAPLIVLPFTALLLVALTRLRSDWDDPLRRLLWLWFGAVFALFSLSSTQLPHYLLYGCTPLFVLMAVHRDQLRSRWLAFLPPLLLAVALLFLPELLGLAAPYAKRLYEQEIVALGRSLLDPAYRAGMAAAVAAMLAVAFWRRLPPWQGLVAVGFVQLLAVTGLVLPVYFAATQGPVKEAAAVARALGEPVIAYRVYLPSFSLYRQAVTPRRAPQPGDLVFTRVDRVDKLLAGLPGVPSEVVYRRGGVTLIRFAPTAGTGGGRG
jgi:4-amino-4-deoxy-L-arabinose transferase-like glycosyltransferase